MGGRTQAECEALQREADEDDRRADDLYDPESASSYADYLRRRAAWKRHLGSGIYRTDYEDDE